MRIFGKTNRVLVFVHGAAFVLLFAFFELLDFFFGCWWRFGGGSLLLLSWGRGLRLLRSVEIVFVVDFHHGGSVRGKIPSGVGDLALAESNLRCDDGSFWSCSGENGGELAWLRPGSSQGEHFWQAVRRDPCKRDWGPGF